MSARWTCKVPGCGRWGLGGPDGWRKHNSSAHTDDARLGASASFGFVPNYANGKRTRYFADWVDHPHVIGLPPNSAKEAP